jgi:predicted permease
MLSRLGMLVFFVLPIVVVALGLAVAAVLALGWAIQHVITRRL